MLDNIKAVYVKNTSPRQPHGEVSRTHHCTVLYSLLVSRCNACNNLFYFNRAGLLDNIKAAYVKNISLANLMVDPDFAASLNSRQNAWRRVVSLCVAR